MMGAQTVMENTLVDNSNVLRDAVRQAGGPRKFARLVGVSSPAVSQWCKLATMPLEHLPQLAAHSTYTVRQLIDYIALHHPRYARLAEHIGPGSGLPRGRRPKPKAAADYSTFGDVLDGQLSLS
jgi:hypothetical protein